MVQGRCSPDFASSSGFGYASRLVRDGTTTTRIPAAVAESTPLGASSKTRQSAGSSCSWLAMLLHCIVVQACEVQVPAMHWFILFDAKMYAIWHVAATEGEEWPADELGGSDFRHASMVVPAQLLQSIGFGDSCKEVLMMALEGKLACRILPNSHRQPSRHLADGP